MAWIGYAAPGWAQVPFAARARSGGRLLAADLAALDAARVEDPPHVTLIGHSYGSTVVGAAMQSGPRRADDLVLVGSPGVLAHDVSRLGMPVGGSGSRRRRWTWSPTSAPSAPTRATAASALPGCGRIRARRVPAEQLRRAHSRYFDPGSESLRNIARVVVGRDADVTRRREAA